MADMTVYPDALALELSVEVPTLPGAQHIESPETLTLEAGIFTETVVISFPTISRSPSHVFSDELPDDSVLIGNTASGYPLLNKRFTLGLRTITPDYRRVSEADKLVVMAFYEATKDTSFPYYNKQDDTTYEVVFMAKPTCVIDGLYNLWRIGLTLLVLREI